MMGMLVSNGQGGIAIELQERIIRAMEAPVFKCYSPRAVLRLARMAGEFANLPAEFQHLIVEAEEQLRIQQQGETG